MLHHEIACISKQICVPQICAQYTCFEIHTCHFPVPYTRKFRNNFNFLMHVGVSFFPPVLEMHISWNVCLMFRLCSWCCRRRRFGRHVECQAIDSRRFRCFCCAIPLIWLEAISSLARLKGALFPCFFFCGSAPWSRHWFVDSKQVPIPCSLVPIY